MIANVREDYSFKVIDPAVPADIEDYTKPRRLLLLVGGAVMGGLGGISIAVFLGILSNRRRTRALSN
jgi:uncharacterized protein involved in exopolysaccharide biosynthesis